MQVAKADTNTNTYSMGTLIGALYDLTTSTDWTVGTSWINNPPWTEYTVDMLALTIQTGVKALLRIFGREAEQEEASESDLGYY